MSSTGDWFKDPVALADEVRRATEPRVGVPEVRGYAELLEIGRGGQGIVFRAVHRATRQPVAVKVLFDSVLGTESVRRRFEREIDLAAQLRHPSVVRLTDSGATADGRLYLAMELIEGQPLHTFVRSLRPEGGDEAPSAARARVRRVLELFVTIGDAVHYAHQRGVIHRDLKPGNVLVDAEGRPHVLDFGLAKAHGVETSTWTSATGRFVGSLPWSSPEQARGDDQATDVRTDVYALGVMLYHALADRFPYDVGGTLQQTLANIASADPARLAIGAEPADEELDLIVRTCLAKEPERRYGGAGELAADLRRYLAGEPIAAKQDSAWYAVRKRLRRHRTAVIASASVTAAACAALVVIAVLWSRAAAERDRAQLAEELAGERLAEMTAVTEFLERVFTSVDPGNDGPEVRVVSVLKSAGEELPASFPDRPAVRARLHDLIGQMYWRLGMNEPAGEHLRTGMELRRETLGETHSLTLNSTSNYALLLLATGDLAGGAPLLRRTLEAQSATLGEEHADTQITMNNLAVALRWQNKLDEAEPLYRRVLELRRAAGPLDTQGLQTVNNYASLQHSRGDFAAAEALYREALDGHRALSGPDGPEAILTLNNLGKLLMDVGRLEEAEAAMREGHGRAVRVYGEEHPTTLSAANNLGKLLHQAGKRDEALEFMTRTAEARRRTLGAEHPHTLISLNNLAVLLGDLGRVDEAGAVLGEVLETRRRTLGERHVDTVVSLANLARVLAEGGRAAEGVAMAEEAVGIAEEVAPLLVREELRHGLGRCLLRAGRLDEAEAVLEAARAAIAAAHGEEHPAVQRIAASLEEVRAARAAR